MGLPDMHVPSVSEVRQQASYTVATAVNTANDFVSESPGGVHIPTLHMGGMILALALVAVLVPSVWRLGMRVSLNGMAVDSAKMAKLQPAVWRWLPLCVLPWVVPQLMAGLTVGSAEGLHRLSVLVLNDGRDLLLSQTLPTIWNLRTSCACLLAGMAAAGLAFAIVLSAAGLLLNLLRVCGKMRSSTIPTLPERVERCLESTFPALRGLRAHGKLPKMGKKASPMKKRGLSAKRR